MNRKCKIWSIETHTRLIREVKRTQIRLNLLIGLRRKTVKSIFYTKVDKMITAIIRSVFLKSERFLLFVNCRETQHRTLVNIYFSKSKNTCFGGQNPDFVLNENRNDSPLSTLKNFETLKMEVFRIIFAKFNFFIS